MDSEGQERSQLSLAERLMPVDEMQVETSEESMRLRTLLDGPLEATNTTTYDSGLPDQGLEASMEEGAGLTNLANRIAKNRLYTRDETAPDAPETRVPSHVLNEVDLEFLNEVVSESPIRSNALHLSGTPLAHLSTDKIFHYVTQYAPVPLGVEWISDNRLVLVFQDGREAKIAISLLAKTGFDPYPPNNDDPLELRAAKAVPRRLLPLPENEPTSDETTSDDKIVRPRKSDALDPTDLLFDRKRDLVPVKKTNDEDLPEGLREGARLDIRYAMESDVKARTAAKDSQWYKQHGRTAGKGINAREQGHRHSPYGRRRSASPGSRNVNENDRRERGGTGRRPRRTQTDLDAELDAMRSGTFVEPATDISMDTAEEPSRNRRQGGRRDGNRREQRSQADLDAELEAFLADRGERGESVKEVVDKSNRFE